MIDKDAQGAAERFMRKLTDGNFIMEQLPNSEVDYDSFKQQRDSKAVEQFVHTKVFEDIIKLK